MLAGPIGAEGSYQVDIVDGVVKVKVLQDGANGKANLELELKLADLLREVALKTDNKWDDALVEYLIRMLG
jgi:hypothetical protein